MMNLYKVNYHVLHSPLNIDRLQKRGYQHSRFITILHQEKKITSNNELVKWANIKIFLQQLYQVLI